MTFGNSNAPQKSCFLDGDASTMHFPLGANLLKKKFNINGLCAFECNSPETDDHLFLNCPFARRTWLGSPLTIRPCSAAPNGFRHWLGTLLNNCDKNDHCKEIFIGILTFAWALYTHRNQVRFQQKTISSEDVWSKWQNMKLYQRQLMDTRMLLPKNQPTKLRES